MQVFDEGRIRFAFPAAWAVLKYDDSQYYRGTVTRTGAGLAAVDFVAARPQPLALLLLEVKDFRQHSVENRPRLHSGELATEAATKALHTLGMLHVGMRVASQEIRAIAATLNHAADVPTHFVLLLEDDLPPQIGPSGYLSTDAKFKRDTYFRLRGDVLILLKNRLRPFRITAKLYNCTEVPSREGWTATILP